MQWIEQIGDDFGGTIALAGLLVALMALGVGIMALRDRRSWHAQLRDRSAWPTLLTDLNMLGPKPRYLAGTARFNTLADRWFGDRLLSWRVLDQCLRIELLLPVMAALLGWALFDINSLGDLLIAAPEQPIVRRVTAVAILIMTGFASTWLMLNDDRLTERIDQWLEPTRGHAVSYFAPFGPAISATLNLITSLLISMIAIALLLVGGLGVMVYADLLGLFAIAGAIISVPQIFGGIGSIAFTTLFFVAFLFVTSLLGDHVIEALTLVGSFDSLGYYTTILLLVILPAINALADVVSVTATRVFMRRIARGGQTVLTIAVELVFDLILAIITLFALIFAICAGLDLWADLAPGRLAFDWRAYRQQVLDAPAEGIMLYGMAVTTLIPTLMHVAAGTAALFGTRGHLVALARDQLAELNANLPTGTQIPPETAQGPLRAIDKMLRRSHRSGWIAGFLCAVLVAAIAAALVGWVLTWWPTLQAFPYA